LKLKVRNFQKIASVDLELDGFTVITGSSNRGKSALLRAMVAVFFGRPGDDFIRYGEDWCSVVCEHEDHRIDWYKSSKGQGPTTLIIDGTKYTKMGKDGHQVQTEKFGYKEVRVRDKRLRPQVAAQHDPPFLVAESDTIIADMFKALGRADVVTEAMTDCKKDVKQTVWKRDLRKNDLNVKEAELVSLGYVEAMEERRVVLSRKVDNVITTVEDAKKISRTLLDYNMMHPREVPASPVINPIQPSVEKAEEMVKYINLKESKVPEVPTLKGLDPVFKVVNSLQSWHRHEEEARKVSQDSRLNKDDIVVAEAHKEMMEKELKVCPVCGKGFDV